MTEIQAVFFDLDGTLYSDQSGLWLEIRRRIDRYMIERMHFSVEEVAQLRQHFLDVYGTTLRGLQVEHQINSDEYLHYVHDIPLEQYIGPDPGLAAMLRTLKRPRWVLTNSDLAHARRVLSTLGVSELLPEIIDIKALGFLCKPQIAAYQKALQISQLNSAEGCLLVEDSSRNIIPARQLGFYTVMVGENSKNSPAHISIQSIHELREVLPELWN